MSFYSGILITNEIHARSGNSSLRKIKRIVTQQTSLAMKGI